MQKIALGLSALILIAAAPKPSVAQDANPAAAPEVQAPDPRDEMQIAQLRAREAQLRSDEARRNGAPVASQTWRENPSLMDSSWRIWPSLIDF